MGSRIIVILLIMVLLVSAVAMSIYPTKKLSGVSGNSCGKRVHWKDPLVSIRTIPGRASVI